MRLPPGSILGTRLSFGSSHQPKTQAASSPTEIATFHAGDTSAAVHTGTAISATTTNNSPKVVLRPGRPLGSSNETITTAAPPSNRYSANTIAPRTTNSPLGTTVRASAAGIRA